MSDERKPKVAIIAHVDHGRTSVAAAVARALAAGGIKPPLIEPSALVHNRKHYPDLMDRLETLALILGDDSPTALNPTPERTNDEQG